MPGAAPFIAPLLLGAAGAVDANVQNKSAIANRDNAAAAAQQQVKQNQGNAFANLSGFANQGAAQPAAGGQPRFQGQNIPLAGGQPQQAPQGQGAAPQITPQQQAQLLALLQQSKGGMA